MASRLMRLLPASLLLAPILALAQSPPKVGPLRIETLPNAALLGSATGDGLKPVAIGGGLTLSDSTLSANVAGVTSVAGRTGAVTLDASDVSGFIAAAAAAAPVQTVAGRVGTVTLTPSDVSGFNAAVAAAAPVQSVAGRGGAVSLSATDVTGLGTMATQNSNAAAIIGGTINSTVIGGTTPAAATFTTETVNGVTSQEVVRENPTVG